MSHLIPMIFTQSELEQIATCVQMRKKYIETGSPVLSVNDLRERKICSVPTMQPSQIEFLNKLEKLRKKVTGE